ncbi:hypothetical protein ACFQQB_55785 [Nonomuraea rubra]|uniref:glycosyl hydrolase 2 galactose-binding domain-containing protein n=1 Tax=Nonomuraea rubra TaxID=46180 RepID=UPI00361D7856
MTKQSRSLDSGWTLRLAGGAAPAEVAGLRDEAVPAQVPGCVHADLLAAGLIPDPYRDLNELDVAWAGRADWRYDTALAAAPPGFERTDLVFDGLDTVARVLLDGQELGRTRNMHRSYRFDVTGRVRDGSALSVLFTSAYTEAESLRERLGARPNEYPEPFNYIRKMAASFGWDWGPPSSPPASGVRCGWRAGAPPGWPRSGRWSPSPARTAGSRRTSSWNAPPPARAAS